MFHVSSTRNRASIQRYGLDWSRMSGVPGIAGSREPEVDGIFVSEDHFTAEFFVRINNTGGPVDIWAIDDALNADLVESGSGFSYLPYRIDRQRLTLLGQALLPPVESAQEGGSGSSGAYGSNLTIALEDGTVLYDDAAHAYIANRPAVE